MSTGHRPRAFNRQEFIPGFTEASTSKFGRIGASVIAGPGAYDTTTNTASNSLQGKHYVVPSKKGSAGLREVSNNPKKKFLAQSLAASEFVDHLGELFQLESLAPKDVKAAFDRVDVDRSGFIDKREILSLLQSVLGGDAPVQPRLIDSLMAFFDANKDGKISLEELQTGLTAVKNQRSQQINKPGTVSRHTKPQWMRPPDKKRTVLHDVSTSITASDVGVKDAGYIRDLELGTQKATSHIPGYSGYIPSVGTGTAARQAEARNTRADKNDMILNETFNPSIDVYRETRYGSMQTTNSKRNNLVNNMFRASKEKE
jgi:Ca2+-binding EF-hand superfamily protein